MLIINRLRITIVSADKEHVFDRRFSKGLNIIFSDDNTKGKSSVIIGIYYGLGLEEIIGGANEKVLTSVYKTLIETQKGTLPVLQSSVCLEISNGQKAVTIYRSAKQENRDPKLVTVYFSDMDHMYADLTGYEDYYINMKYSAIGRKGFHKFLADFLDMQLPDVIGTDGEKRKLYLQLIFSSAFIEQKNGWSGIYSDMPYLGIKDQKKRVTEYVVGLKTFQNEQQRNALKLQETNIINKWKELHMDILREQTRNLCKVTGFPVKPEILNDDFLERVHIQRVVDSEIPLREWVLELTNQIDALKTIKPKVADNYDELNDELGKVEKEIASFESAAHEMLEQLHTKRFQIRTLTKNIQVLNQDILNNEDTRKLQKLGSEVGAKSFSQVCPTCNQRINDTLLPMQHQFSVMSIDATLKHLKSQKAVLEFSLESQRTSVIRLESNIEAARQQLARLYKLAKAIRRDLFSVDEDLSEAVIYKRMSLETQVEQLKEFEAYLQAKCREAIDLSEEWKSLQSQKALLPETAFNDRDKEILAFFEKKFKENLKRFNYTSVTNLGRIAISNDTYMPIINRFDMKFDSSASDNIRAIWAYTMALLQTSIFYSGGHPKLCILDEPAQHSIGANDNRALFDTIIEMKNACQVIIGMTVNNEDLSREITKLEKEGCTMIHIGDKAFI